MLAVPSRPVSMHVGGGVMAHAPAAAATTATTSGAHPLPAPALLAPPPSSSSSSRLGERSPDAYIEERETTHRLGGGSQDKVVNRYRRGRLLGKGGFARCYEMTEISTGRLFAGKIIAKSSLAKARAKAKLETEIEIHKSLHHPNIVDFQRWFEDKDFVYILLELCPNQTLMEMVKKRRRLTEPETQWYLAQLVSACKNMQSQNVIHRDLKLGNLFLGPDLEIKVGDFGLATRLSHEGEKKRTICGTPNYIAPEILDGRRGHSFEVDSWSIGVIVYTLLIGKPPFETADVKSTYKKIKANSYVFPDNIRISEDAKSLIRKLLSSVPEARPTLNDIMLHPFMAKAGRLPRSLPKSALNSIPHEFVEEAIRNGAVSRQPLGDVAYAGTSSSSSSSSSAAAAASGPYGVASMAPSSSAVAPSSSSAAAAVGSHAPSSVASLPVPSSKDRIGDRENNYGSVYTRPASAYASLPGASSGPVGSSGTTAARLDERADEVRRALETKHNNVILKERPSTAAPAVAAASSSRATAAVSSVASKPSVITAAAASAAEVADAHHNLSLSAEAQGAEVCSQLPLAMCPVWVTKWVDYSNKYGLGYQLSNGSTGVYFNDSTKILVAADGVTVQYYDRKRTPSGSYDEAQSFVLPNHPESLQKKVTLLRHFKNYLLEHAAGPVTDAEGATVATVGTGMPPAAAAAAAAAGTTAAPPVDDGAVYVKKWLMSKHAIIFRLSSRTVQVNLYDHSKTISHEPSGVVAYVDKQRHLRVYPLKGPHPADLGRRLKYSKDILNQLMQQPNGDKQI